jgi:hypothetical protein
MAARHAGVWPPILPALSGEPEGKQAPLSKDLMIFSLSAEQLN